MTIKASALLAIAVIWATMVPAVMAEDGQYWTIVFAVLATMAIGSSFWRSFGLSRLLAVAGTWAGAALATADGEGWVTIFAFLSTGAAVHSIMRASAVLNGIGIAVPWLVVAAVTADSDGSASWICVFAFLTAVTVANHRSERRGVAAVLWWGAAGAVMLLTHGWHWMAVFAWLLSTASLGFGGFWFPRKIEWDLFERD